MSGSQERFRELFQPKQVDFIKAVKYCMANADAKFTFPDMGRGSYITWSKGDLYSYNHLDGLHPASREQINYWNAHKNWELVDESTVAECSAWGHELLGVKPKEKPKQCDGHWFF